VKVAVQKVGRLEIMASANLRALFLRKLDTLGTVEPGKLADLVLLDGNPLDDIHNTARISAVISRGAVISHPMNAQP